MARKQVEQLHRDLRGNTGLILKSCKSLDIEVYNSFVLISAYFS